MAILDALPSQWVIDKYKGIIDFYLWKGIPVARKWPHIPPYQRTPEELATQQALRYIMSLLPHIEPTVLALYKRMAHGYYLSWRDYLIRHYLHSTNIRCHWPPWDTLPRTMHRVAITQIWHQELQGEFLTNFITDTPCRHLGFQTWGPPEQQPITKYRRGNIAYRDYLALHSHPAVFYYGDHEPDFLLHAHVILKPPDTNEVAYTIAFHPHTDPPEAPSALSPSTGPYSILKITFP